MNMKGKKCRKFKIIFSIITSVIIGASLIFVNYRKSETNFKLESKKKIENKKLMARYNGRLEKIKEEVAVKEKIRIFEKKKSNLIAAVAIAKENKIKQEEAKKQEEKLAMLKKQEDIKTRKTGKVEEKAVVTQQTQKYVKLDVPYINQKSPIYAPMGCEGASLLMALKYKGVNNVDFKGFLDKMPKSPDNNPFNGFSGSPYDVEDGIFQSIFPGALANYGKQYKSSVMDISGSSPSDLKIELDNGNPVVVYVTNRSFEAPRLKEYTFGGKRCTIIDNLHVVLLAGYNDNNKTYYIADPNAKGYYWISKDKFETAYNCSKWAVTVR